MVDFIKIGGIVIKDRKLLVVRVKTIFINLGGKVEPGETHEECLIREAKEEIGCEIKMGKFFGTYEAEAVLDPGKIVKIETYFCEVLGVPKPNSEVSEIKYITSDFAGSLGSILKDNILPELKALNLID